MDDGTYDTNDFTLIDDGDTVIVSSSSGFGEGGFGEGGFGGDSQSTVITTGETGWTDIDTP